MVWGFSGWNSFGLQHGVRGSNTCFFLLKRIRIQVLEETRRWKSVISTQGIEQQKQINMLDKILGVFFFWGGFVKDSFPTCRNDEKSMCVCPKLDHTGMVFGFTPLEWFEDVLQYFYGWLAGKWGPRIEWMYSLFENGGFSSNRYVSLPEGMFWPGCAGVEFCSDFL